MVAESVRMNDDAALLERARAGDPRAFEALMNQHATQVYNLALRLVRDPREAEDLTQEAFVRAWRGLPRFRAEACFGTWLYRIVTNLCYDRLPRLRAEMAALDTDALAALPDETQAADTALLTAELRAYLHQAIDTLPDGFRLLLTLRHLQNMSYADIAAATDLPEGTVKSGLFRARTQLREAVARYGAATAAVGAPGAEGVQRVDDVRSTVGAGNGRPAVVGLLLETR